MADRGPLGVRRREARDAVARLRSEMQPRVAMALLWTVLAAVQWAGGDPDWTRWAWPALALASTGPAIVSWRRLRRARAGSAGFVGVDLRPVAEAMLSRLVAAALDGAEPDEVTPPVTSGKGWTPERIEWLRAFHRDRRQGFAGPAQERTWAVVEITAEGGGAERVVGSVRLRRTGEAGVVETGIWLTRDARGRGVGRHAVRLVLERARAAGAGSVRAETTPGNAGAVALLRSSGFRVEPAGEHVRADLHLS